MDVFMYGWIYEIYLKVFIYGNLGEVNSKILIKLGKKASLKQKQLSIMKNYIDVHW
jgi:hypothetical protein